MKKIFKYLIIIILTVIIWGLFIEPNLLIVRHYKIKNESLKGTKIVFATDFHLKQNEYKKLRKIIKKINAQNADIVLLGGDYVNGQVYQKTLHPKTIARETGNIKSKYGVFSVLGNHDFWLDGNKIKSELQKYGIQVLSNQNKSIKLKNNQKLYIAGVEDLSTGNPDMKKALKNTSSPVILISHSPDVFPEVPSSVLLTLAGHTHGGQIVLPFYGPVFVPSEFGKKYVSGLIEENNKKMIVSKGIGTSILPVRFGCIPEIVVVEFYY